MKKGLAAILALIVGIVIGWLASSEGPVVVPPPESIDGNVVKMICSMHPWINSDGGSECIVCGMTLVSSRAAGRHLPKTGKSVQIGSEGIVVARVKTRKVSRRVLSREIRLSGWIRKNDARDHEIKAFLPGRIEKLYVGYEGIEVSKGMPVYSIYSPILLEWEKEYNLLYRQSQMNHSSRITAEHGRLLQAMRKRLEQYGLTRKQIDALPNKPEYITVTDINAPADGLVIGHSVTEGQYVKEGDPLLSLADQFSIWFEFDVYETDYPFIKLGQTVKILVPGARRQNTSGNISFINVDLNGESRSTTARVDIQNPAIRILGIKTRQMDLNMYAEGIVKIESASVNSVPRSAVLTSGPTHLVFVETAAGVFERREIGIGFKGEGYWEVNGGLDIGEKVVTEGGVLLDSESRL
jgi:membrane fusion protein, copper/silver efflux system